MVYIPPPHVERPGVSLKPDLSRHLSAEAKARLPNPIKSIWKAAQVKPGTINMGNGMGRTDIFLPAIIHATQATLTILFTPFARSIMLCPP